jgi:hypothetical protein
MTEPILALAIVARRSGSALIKHEGGRDRYDSILFEIANARVPPGVCQSVCHFTTYLIFAESLLGDSARELLLKSWWV